MMKTKSSTLHSAPRPKTAPVWLTFSNTVLDVYKRQDPNIEPSAYKVNEEEAKKWLAAGAQPTDVVAKIFKEAGIEK